MLSFKLEHHRTHPFLDGSPKIIGCRVAPHPKLPRDARLFWRVVDLIGCEGGVLAWRKERLVGLCRYNLDYKASSLRTASELAMAGTWVAPRYRRRELAVRMWNRVLRYLQSGTEVQVITVSTHGDQLVNKLISLHPRLHFKRDQGCRYPQLEADRGRVTA